MFSVANMTAVLFVIFFIGLGFMIWIDGKKTYIVAPKYNHKNGDQETSGENASAEFDANEKTGSLSVSAGVEGSGKATAWSELGYEYENTEQQAIKMIVELKVGFQFDLTSANEAAKVSSVVATCLNDECVTMAETTLPLAENQSPPQMGVRTVKSQRHVIDLDPDEKVTMAVKLSAQVDGAESGRSDAKVSATLEEISYRPEVQVK